jgi:hypothetical protein
MWLLQKARATFWLEVCILKLAFTGIISTQISILSDIKTKVHNIAVFDKIFLAFNSQFAGCFDFLF